MLPGMATTDKAVAGTHGAPRQAERRFYTGMAVAILGTAVVGFARTYFLRPLLPVPSPVPPALTPLIHLHGALFTGWVLLLLVQARLVAGRRLDLHRQLGFLGAVLAAGMVIVGTLTALHGALRGVAPFGIEPRRFLIIPLFALVLFALFAVAAIFERRDAQSHKRWILLATIALLPPALARWAIELGIGPPFILALATLFVVPLVVWDLKTRRSLHPVTLWAGSLLVLSGPLRLVLSRTDGWLRIADWLVAGAR